MRQSLRTLPVASATRCVLFCCILVVTVQTHAETCVVETDILF